MEFKKDSKNFSTGNIIFYVVSLSIFIIVIKHISELKTTAKLFKDINLKWLIFAFLAQIGTYITLSLVYKILSNIDKLKNKISFREILNLSFLSVFLNHTLPSGGISGNFFIFKSLASFGISKSKALSIVVIESILMYIAYLFLIFSVLGTYIIYSDHTAPHYFSIALFVGVVFYSLLMFLVAFLGRGKKLFHYTRKFFHITGIRNLIKKLNYFPEETLHLESPWKIMKENILTSFYGLLLQFGLFFFDVFTVFALFRGFNSDIEFIKVLIAFIPTAIVGGLPISPGSLLVYETGMTFFYTSLGVPIGTAIIVTLLYRALSFWLTIPIGLFVYKKHKFQPK